MWVVPISSPDGGSATVIDLDQMEEQLEMARTGGRAAVAPAPPPRRPSPPRPTPAPRRRQRAAAVSAAPPAPPAGRPASGHPAGIRELLEAGLLDEVDAEIAAHARRAGDPTWRLDAATWATMRALFDGRRAPVAAGIESMRQLAVETGDAEVWDRYWRQRFSAALEWGDENERYDVLDHCRTQAYRFDDLSWWGPLTLLLAELHKADEATRAFDEAHRLLSGARSPDVRLDLVTDLIEAAAVLGDAGRAVLAHRSLGRPSARMVVVGPGVVCKGSVERYRALGLAAAGRMSEAGECFRLAADAHRALGAAPLLDRTRQQSERFSRVAA